MNVANNNSEFFDDPSYCCFFSEKNILPREGVQVLEVPFQQSCLSKTTSIIREKF